MAWEQIIYPITSYVEQGTIVNFSCCENSYFNRQGDDANIAFIANYMTGGFTDSINLPSAETEIFRQGAFSITLKQGSVSGAGRGFEVRCKEDGQTLKLVFSDGGNDSHKDFIKVGFAIDRQNQRGAFVVGSYSQDNYYARVGRRLSNIDESNTERNLYNWLIQAIPILYTWSSVPAISGKNKTVSLTTLKEESINDGSPVDDATVSAFNNAPNSCSVGGIVSKDLPIIDDNPLSIALKYNIPELTDSVYSSCKVVAKKNKIPKSKTDGDKILDVSPSSHGCVIKGLEQETKYYVVVFVEDSFGNKAESEPGGPVRTGKQSGIFKIRITASQGVKDNDFKEVITITKQ